MKSRNKKKKTAADLHFENELRKVKMQLEKGAQIQSSGDIPPELESMFLDHIEKFDKAYKTAKQISIYERLGSPKYKAAESIPEKSIKKELNALISKMSKKGIIVESVCPVDPREMYRFITEELFTHKIDDISIKGMMTHFTYEEFHPNHEHDVKSHTEDFICDILSDKEEIATFLLGKKFKLPSGRIISSEKAIEKINFLRSFYSTFEIEDFLITSLKINSQKTAAEVTFDISYNAKIEGSGDKQNFTGKGKASLKNRYDFWTIYSLVMPGLKL